MSDLPLISVIVPVYNVEKYLNRCVESIVGQTYDNLEILLVDDGSTDNSGILCDVWSERDERVFAIEVMGRYAGDLARAGRATPAAAPSRWPTCSTMAIPGT